MSRGCYFDLKAAEKVRDFFRLFLRHSKGQFADEPFELLDWQWDGVIAPMFGWKRKDGTRRFRTASIWIPKKNGKSTLCSGISLYLLIADGERGPEVYSAASDRAQASIVYREAASMVRKSPDLAARLLPLDSQKRIKHPLADGFYLAMSADVPTKEGINWNGLIFDELHAQKQRALWDTLRYGGVARQQPLLVTISTAGYDRLSIGYEVYSYAKGVMEGTIEDDEFLPYVAEAGPEDDWTKSATWKKANPSFGVTISESDFAAACREAQASPTKENAFRRYRLNQWTEQDVRWVSLEKWDASGRGSNLSPDELCGAKCFGGLDLASTTDLAAFALYFPERHAVLAWFWCPEDVAKERERTNRATFRHWIQRGLITATEGNVIDYDRIRHDIRQLAARYDIQSIGIDRWNATQLSTQLAGDGLSMFKFGQGFASMSDPMKSLEAMILGGKLIHFANPVLRWMVSNVAAETDAAGNVKPSKKKSSEKIDGVVAVIMAVGISNADTGAGGPSTYEGEGLLIL